MLVKIFLTAVNLWKRFCRTIFKKNRTLNLSNVFLSVPCTKYEDIFTHTHIFSLYGLSRTFYEDIPRCDSDKTANFIRVRRTLFHLKKARIAVLRSHLHVKYMFEICRLLPAATPMQGYSYFDVNANFPWINWHKFYPRNAVRYLQFADV